MYIINGIKIRYFFHKGYANAEDDHGWFHINIKGEQIYNLRYKVIEPFYNGYAKVETFDGTLGQVDTKGNIKYIISTLGIVSRMHQVSKGIGRFLEYISNECCLSNGNIRIATRQI